MAVGEVAPAEDSHEAEIRHEQATHPGSNSFAQTKFDPLPPATPVPLSPITLLGMLGAIVPGLGGVVGQGKRPPLWDSSST